MFNLFNRGPKALQGRIIDEKSGIYVDLPEGWNAYAIPDNYLIGAAKEKGTLIFSVTNYILVERGDGLFHHPFTDEPIEPEVTSDGDFETFTIQVDERWYLQTWDTDTEKYQIRFIYMYEKKYYDSEIKFIRQILESLFKNPGV